MNDELAYIPLDRIKNVDWEFIFEQLDRNTDNVANLLSFIRKRCNNIDDFGLDATMKSCAHFMFKNKHRAIEMTLDPSESPWFSDERP